MQALTVPPTARDCALACWQGQFTVPLGRYTADVRLGRWQGIHLPVTRASPKVEQAPVRTNEPCI